MGGLDHHPAEPASELSAGVIARNTRQGLILFAVYLAFYAAFVLISAFRHEWMDRIVLAGLNLAVVYGFGLIIGALVIALIYGWLCRESAPTGRMEASR